MDKNLKLEVIAGTDGFLGLEKEWNCLLDKSRSKSVFLTWEWLYNWWKYFGQDSILRIVTVREEDGRLIGVAPFCIRWKKGLLPVNVLTFMGMTFASSEYLDVIVEPGREKDVVSSVFDLLQKDSCSWDYAVFSDMLDSSVLMISAKEYLKHGEYLVREDLSQSCPYLPLPTKKEDFLNSLGKETRATLKRRTKRLLEMGAEIRLVKNSSEISEALKSLFQLHQKRWTLRGLTGNFRDKQIRSFHLDTANRFLERDMLRLYQIKVADKAIASLYCFRYKDIVFYFQAGFDPAWSSKSPGMVLMGHGIQDSIENGMGEFDYLRGLEPYKFRWTDKVRDTWYLTVVPKGRIRGMLSLRLDLIMMAAKKFVKRLILPGERGR